MSRPRSHRLRWDDGYLRVEQALTQGLVEWLEVDCAPVAQVIRHTPRRAPVRVQPLLPVPDGMLEFLGITFPESQSDPQSTRASLMPDPLEDRLMVGVECVLADGCMLEVEFVRHPGPALQSAFMRAATAAFSRKTLLRLVVAYLAEAPNPAKCVDLDSFVFTPDTLQVARRDGAATWRRLQQALAPGGVVAPRDWLDLATVPFMKDAVSSEERLGEAAELVAGLRGERQDQGVAMLLGFTSLFFDWSFPTSGSAFDRTQRSHIMDLLTTTPLVQRLSRDSEAEGRAMLLAELLTARLGPLPDLVAQSLASAMHSAVWRELAPSLASAASVSDLARRLGMTDPKARGAALLSGAMDSDSEESPLPR